MARIIYRKYVQRSVVTKRKLVGLLNGAPMTRCSKCHRHMNWTDAVCRWNESTDYPRYCQPCATSMGMRFATREDMARKPIALSYAEYLQRFDNWYV